MNGFTLSLVLMLSVVSSAAGGEVSVRMAVAENPKQEYFLIDHSGGQEPEGGYKLILVIPGGDGSADFNPFVTNLGKHAAGPDYLMAQLIAVKWTPGQPIVWPTGADDVEGSKFTTEEFIGAVVSDIRKFHKLNSRHIYTLSWSSGGPAAYAASLEIEDLKGSFIAMSVFKPSQLSGISKAKGHRYYIYHSPEDRVCPIRMAEDAKDKLAKEGADVEFVRYEGGHGWHGDIFGAIRTGIAWLEKR